MRWGRRLLLLLGGLVLGQLILYAPSLLGFKILLPLDILTGPGVYIPQTGETRAIPISNIYLSDIAYLSEPARMYVTREFAHGRFPSWVPYQYAGSPLLAPVFSPILAWQHWVSSPLAVAWTQVWAALVGGVGAFLFWRRCLGLGWLAALVAAWCYPLTAFFVFWQGYYLVGTVYMLPWLLCAVHGVTSTESPFAVPGLALATGATLVSGALDMAGQVLLASGLYAAWRLVENWRLRAPIAKDPPAAETNPRTRIRSPFRMGIRLTRLAAGWALGFMLAAHWVLPVMEYARTGARIAAREEGREERPPIGISALPQVVLPDIYGAFGKLKLGSFRISSDNQQESAAAGYTGFAATLLLAPLAWYHRQRRSLCWFLAGLAVFSLGWSLNLPGMVQLLRLPVLNMMSHNRFVFVTAFALLTLAAIGLDTLRNQAIEWRQWMWAPAALSGILLAHSVFRALNLPEPIATQMEESVRQGFPLGWVRTPEAVYQVQDWFIGSYSRGALVAGLCLAGWVLLARRFPQKQLVIAAAVLIVTELLWFGRGRNVQASPELYYPRVPALAELAASSPGRVTGVECLPANLAVVSGLEDVRGYDGADPLQYIQLLMLTAKEVRPLPYALVQWQSPRFTLRPDAVQLHPVLDLLGVSHVIFRGAPPAGTKPAFQSPDYWVMRNPNALPRVFIPERVEVVTDSGERLRRIASPDFNPRSICYAETALPELTGLASGQAQISHRGPTRVTVDFRTQTAGMVVLTDRWDPGWHALLNGQPAQIHRVNHALRGVVVQAGTGTLEFFYRPGSRIWGVSAAAIALLVLIAWIANGTRTFLRLRNQA